MTPTDARLDRLARAELAFAAFNAHSTSAAPETGIDEVFTDVEHGSRSHLNCERAGLRTLCINTIWERG